MVQAPVHFRPEDITCRKDWTVAECQAVMNAGLFDLRRYELLEGELISKMGQNRPHLAVINLIISALMQIFDFACIQSPGPIGIGQVDPHNDPEPDVTVLSQPVLSYMSQPPTIPDDILLVVEVSATTLSTDLRRKAGLYASHRLQEYWVVDVNGRELVVHRNPDNGVYLDVQTYNDTQEVSPLAAQTAVVRVADLLP